jgi:hypothetical protein
MTNRRSLIILFGVLSVGSIALAKKGERRVRARPRARTVDMDFTVPPVPPPAPAPTVSPALPPIVEGAAVASPPAPAPSATSPRAAPRSAETHGPSRFRFAIDSGMMWTAFATPQETHTFEWPLLRGYVGWILLRPAPLSAGSDVPAFLVPSFSMSLGYLAELETDGKESIQRHRAVLTFHENRIVTEIAIGAALFGADQAAGLSSGGSCGIRFGSGFTLSFPVTVDLLDQGIAISGGFVVGYRS